jgi:hypothetical protein
MTELLGNALRYKPGARIEGFIVEEQVQGCRDDRRRPRQQILRAARPRGHGRRAGGDIRDVARRYAPIDADTAREMVLGLKAARLLQGYRGTPPRDLDALAEVIARVSWMIADHEASVAEIEINPLIVGIQGRGALAADAVVRFANR